jgi:hypothetical protein
MLIDRRELLEMAVRAAAAPGAAAFFGSWFSAAAAQHAQTGHVSYAPPEPPLLRDYKPQFFDAADFAALQVFTEILIPTDDTPGAREAHCAHYIDFVLQAQAASGQSPEAQKRWRDAMATLRAAGFHAASPAERVSLVEAMAAPERDRTRTHPAFEAFVLIKRQNTFAFYTSRAGTIEALDYRGNAFNATYPGCDHPHHHTV